MRRRERRAPAGYEIGPYRLDLLAREVTRSGEPLEVGARVFELLVALAERAGEPVGKRELMERVWPEKRVGENSLAQAVCEVRRVLGQEGAGFVRTLHDRGYQLTVDALPLSRSDMARGRGAGASRCCRCGSELVPGRLAPAPASGRRSAWSWVGERGQHAVEVAGYRCRRCGTLELRAPSGES